MALVATVDDSDLSQLTYAQHGWFTAGSSSEYNQYFFLMSIRCVHPSHLLRSTTHGTSSPGATVTFKFNGTIYSASSPSLHELTCTARDYRRSIRNRNRD